MSLASILSQHGVPINVGPGRRAAPPPVARVVRELTAEDLLEAGTTEGLGSQPIPIKSLRQSHHTLAQLLAKGEKPANISIITGYSISRISILKSDPSFQELLSYYEDMEAEGYKLARADMRERLAQFGFDTMEVLQERISEEPEKFTNKELILAAELALDRIGHGKTSTVNTNHEHSISPETLAKIRAQSETPANITAEDRAALIRAVCGPTEAHPEAQAADGQSSGGDGLRTESEEGTCKVLAERPLPSVD